MALDLGASDLLMLPMDPAETALRLRTQLTRKRQADRLRTRLRDGLELAMVDPLTELYNRRYGLAHLRRVHDRALARGRGYALLLVDLDRFKSVNDRFGHAAGDTVLGTVAGRLRARLRGVDLISRIGGEEFMIVMPEMGLEAAHGAAKRLCAAVAGEATVLPDGTRIAQTVSIGLALGGLSASDTAEDAMARADRALYVAKSGGRNRTHLDRSGRIAAA
jgi:two-component system cell cycle response regulator